MIYSIEKDNLIHLNKFKNSPPHPSYIAGFIDGDGNIFIRKIKYGYQSGFTITQCRTNVLQIIRYHFGGSITSSANRNDKIVNLIDDNNYYHKYNVRNQYNLQIRSNEYQILLNYLQNSFIIKEKQYQCLYDFNKIINLPNKNEEKNNLYLKCFNYNNKFILDKIDTSKFNIEYISGLFDAEGCFYINKNNFNYFYISISQKKHPIILNEILFFFKFGKIESSKFKIYKKTDCIKFIQLIKSNLIVKYNQAETFETFLNTQDKNIKKEMYQICNKEKHEIEIFNNLNKNDKGKTGYLEILKIKNLKQKICKEIHNKQIYKIKSEKMKGKGNHNYGKTFSQEIKEKMSISIRQSKCTVSDENILKIKDLIKEGYKNIEIQKMFNLPRHTITRIKNGNILCRNEQKREKKSLTQEKLNLSKRKIQTNEIIFVIEKLIEKWKPLKILDFLIEERNKNNIQNNITINIIKNIKRNLLNNKTNIYESELSKEKYEYYLILLNKFKELI
jgi:hypothetical protein